MTIEEQYQTIGENVEKVYEAGYEKGAADAATDVVQTTGDSVSAVMSQKAVTEELNARLKRGELPDNAVGSVVQKVIVATPMNADGSFDERFRYPLDYAEGSNDPDVVALRGETFDKRHFVKRVVSGDGDYGIVMHSNRDKKLAEGLIDETKYRNYDDHDEPYILYDTAVEKNRSTIAARDENGRFVVEAGSSPFHAVNLHQAERLAFDTWEENLKNNNGRFVDHFKIRPDGFAADESILSNVMNGSFEREESNVDCPFFPMPKAKWIASKNPGGGFYFIRLAIPEELRGKSFSIGLWVYNNISDINSLKFALYNNAAAVCTFDGTGSLKICPSQKKGNYSLTYDYSIGDWYHVTILVPPDSSTHLAIGTTKMLMDGSGYLSFSMPVMVETQLRWYLTYPNAYYPLTKKVGSPIEGKDAVNLEYLTAEINKLKDAIVALGGTV